MTSPDIHAHILKPQPRRTGTINVKQLNIPDHNASAELSPVTSTDSLSGPLFFRRNASPSRSTTSLAAMQPGQRTRSILNLTSSTLFGIYDATHDEPLATATTTPRGSRAQTPARIDSVVDISAQGTHYKVEAMQERPSARATNDFRYPTRLRASPTARLATVVLRSTVLAGIGIAYGLVIEQLHDARAFAPVEVRLDRANWTYLAFWATVAIVLGHALPSVDRALRSDYAGDHVAVLDGEDGKETMADERSTEKKRLANASAGERSSGARPGLSAERISIVRIVGAFVGIAFAIVSLDPPCDLAHYYHEILINVLHSDGSHGPQLCRSALPSPL